MLCRFAHLIRKWNPLHGYIYLEPCTSRHSVRQGPPPNTAAAAVPNWSPDQHLSAAGAGHDVECIPGQGAVWKVMLCPQALGLTPAPDLDPFQGTCLELLCQRIVARLLPEQPHLPRGPKGNYCSTGLQLQSGSALPPLKADKPPSLKLTVVSISRLLTLCIGWASHPTRKTRLSTAH